MYHIYILALPDLSLKKVCHNYNCWKKDSYLYSLGLCFIASVKYFTAICKFPAAAYWLPITKKDRL